MRHQVRIVLVILAATLLLAAPGPLAADVLGDILLAVAKEVGKAVLSAVVQRGTNALIDHVKGQWYEKRLDEATEAAKTKLTTASPDERKTLDREIEIARSQRRTLERLMQSVPSQQELDELRRQVATDLEAVHEVLGEHDQRIGQLEADIRELRSRVESLESRELGPDPSDEARFDEEAQHAQMELETGLQIHFEIDPGDAYVRTWRRGDPRGIVNGQAREYDPREKGFSTLDLPSDGEYLIVLLHGLLPGRRIHVRASSFHDPTIIRLRLGR